MTGVGTPTPQPTRAARARALAVRAGRLEALMYASIGRAVRRRPAVAEGATGFAYHGPTIVLLVAFIVVSAVELVVIDVLVHEWWWLRVPLLVIGIWGLVWMIGLWCAHVMRPHTVGPDGIRVRDGLDLDAHVTWDDVHSVAIRKRRYEPRTPRVIVDGDRRTLAVDVTDETNIEIVLEGPTDVSLPGGPPAGGEQTVTTLCLWADDPKAFLAEVGRHI